MQHLMCFTFMTKILIVNLIITFSAFLLFYILSDISFFDFQKVILLKNGSFLNFKFTKVFNSYGYEPFMVVSIYQLFFELFVEIFPLKIYPFKN